MPLVTLIFLSYSAGLALSFGGHAVAALGGAALLAALGWPRRADAVVAAGVVLLAVVEARRAEALDVVCRREVLRSGEAVVRLQSALAPGRSAVGYAGEGCRLAIRVSATRTAAPDALVRVRGAFSRSGSALAVRDAEVEEIDSPRLLARVRAALARSLERLYRSDAALAKALTIADQRDIARDLRERFADAGIIHMLSVSGLHVSIIAGALVAAFALAGFSPNASTATGVSITIGYVVLIGAPPPAVRSVGMCALAASSRFLQRPTSAWAVWGVGSGISLLEPRTVLDLGWQLSVSGMAGLIASGELLARLALPVDGWRAALLANVVATSVASLASAPLVAWTFGRVSLAAVVTNLVATPLFNVVQPLLFASIIAVPIDPVARFLADAARSGLWLVDLVAKVGAAIPLAALDVRPDLPTAVLLALASGGLLVWCRARRPSRALIVPLLAVSASLWWPFVRPGPGAAEAYIIDVGQGDAIAVRSPRGRWLLVDAGGAWRSGDEAERSVLPLLRRYGGDVVHLILTHPHLDHIGGGARLLAEGGVDTLWDAGYVEPSVPYARLLALARERGVAWRSAAPGDSIGLDGVVVRVLAPSREWLREQRDPNDASVVVQVSYEGVTLLFMGDAGRTEEDWLRERYGDGLRSTVLKVGHHGSATSSSPEFIAAVAPRLAVVSVGAGNRYGHPSPEVLRLLDEAGATVLRTDDAGTIMLRIEGRRLSARADGIRWQSTTP